MPQARSRTFRIARGAGSTLLALCALYLLGGNLLLQTRLLRDATNFKPEQVVLEYDSAYTLFPGHVRVKGLNLRIQDGSIQFELSLDAATVQVALLALTRRQFHATRVRATGVSARALHKVKQLEGAQQRVGAFPRVEGFAWPPIKSPPPEGPPATGEGLWSVRLDDVEAEIRELWMLEYRYVGAGHVVGAFELKPLKSMWVGPARLELKEGALTAGPTVLSRNFAMEAECTIAPYDMPSSPGLRVVRAISADVKLAASLEDVGAAGLYQPGLDASGAGTLTAHLRLSNGRLATGSVLELHLEQLKLRSQGAGFDGTVRASFKLAPDAKGVAVPIGHAAAAGSVRVPIPGGEALLAVLSGAAVDLSLTTADLAEGPELDWLHGRLGEARADDAGPLTAAAGQKAPILAPAVLGRGPLIAAGTADVTREKTVIRLGRARLGGAELTGTAVKAGPSWSGAAAGRVAKVPIGLRLRNEGLEVLPFIGDGWLIQQLLGLGVGPGPLVR